MGKLKDYLFDCGNSNDGPIGFCAVIAAESKAAAVERLKVMLPEFIEVQACDDDSLDPKFMVEGEYINVYFGWDNITEADIDEVAEARMRATEKRKRAKRARRR